MYMVAEDVVFRRVFLYDPFPFNSPPPSLSLFSLYRWNWQIWKDKEQNIRKFRDFLFALWNKDVILTVYLRSFHQTIASVYFCNILLQRIWWTKYTGSLGYIRKWWKKYIGIVLEKKKRQNLLDVKRRNLAKRSGSRAKQTREINKRREKEEKIEKISNTRRKKVSRRQSSATSWTKSCEFPLVNRSCKADDDNTTTL